MTAACLKKGGGGGGQVDPQEITKRNMDQSQALRDMISGNFGGNWVRDSILVGLVRYGMVWYVVDCLFPSHDIPLRKSLQRLGKPGETVMVQCVHILF